jgi:AhpD family alkylhydroperoxidase
MPGWAPNVTTAWIRKPTGKGRCRPRPRNLLGLVASFVLRCDDCIKYHVIRCHEEGVTSEELEEALFVGLIVGGTITIPHQRRAMKAWDELQNQD